MLGMAAKKSTVQVRIPVDLASDINLIAAALGLSVPEYVEQRLRASVSTDLQKTEKIIHDRINSAKTKGRKEN
jgi:hypothetical protein